MPSNQSPLGALPSRFRRPRILIVGCGDVGLRVAQALPAKVRVIALTSSVHRLQALRERGIEPILGNLDEPASLRQLSGLAQRVIHLAPPPAQGEIDPRTRALAQALALRGHSRQIVYASTTGVYGDRAGAWVSEADAPQPRTPRAMRRVDAEQAMAAIGASIVRIPGIYAADREGGTPRERLLKKTPVLQPQDDVYTNHIHADDLARAVIAALWRGKSRRVYNLCDETQLKMGDYFDLAADLYGLPRPPRVSRQAAQGSLPLMLLSFMGESRRIHNERMKRELRVVLQYPHVREGLLAKKAP